MGRKIALSENDIDTAVIDLRQVLSQLRLGVDSKVRMDFAKYLKCENRTATIVFTEKAWFKMQMLIMKFDSEVAWHGVAYRDDDPNSDVYRITDIIVYPQKVTGTNVETDQKPYEMWLMSQEDEVFNNMRMHGHSHVDMPPMPSSVDLQHREDLLEKLKDDMFYIFLIFNKSNTYTAAIYDYGKNVYFDTNDIDIEVEGDENDNIVDFLDAADALVKPVPVTPVYGHNYKNYSSSSYNSSSYNQSKSSKPSDSKLDTKKDNPKKGKRKETSSKDYGGYHNGYADDYEDYGWGGDNYGGWY